MFYRLLCVNELLSRSWSPSSNLRQPGRLDNSAGVGLRRNGDDSFWFFRRERSKGGNATPLANPPYPLLPECVEPLDEGMGSFDGRRRRVNLRRREVKTCCLVPISYVIFHFFRRAWAFVPYPHRRATRAERLALTAYAVPRSRR